MSDLPTCGAVDQRALVARYLARDLSPFEEEAFESHYLACERCQAELRLAYAARNLLREASAAAVRVPELRIVPAAAPPDAAAAPAERRWGRWAAGAAALAAAAVVAMMVVRDRPVPAELARLGEVRQAPVYLGVPVRADPAPAEDRFAAAMQAYAAGRWAEAAAGLGAALDAGVDPAPAEFFRGASLLMLDRPAEAAEAFGRVAALGDTPYRDEARLYRAKALLRLGRTRPAADELARASAGAGEAAAWARALADSLKEVERR